jgi:hypothetical protein
MTAVSHDRLPDLIADHFRFEQACIGALRFISRRIGNGVEVSRADVLAFLGSRRQQLPGLELEQCANEALTRWSASKRRYRGARS